MAEKSGPEKFATPDRRSPEKLIDVDQAAANAFEGETREFVRRDVSVLHRQRSEVDAANDPAADSLNTLVRRSPARRWRRSNASFSSCKACATRSRSEGERVSREISGYANLSHASITATKVIGDNLKQWKNAADKPGPR